MKLQNKYLTQLKTKVNKHKFTFLIYTLYKLVPPLASITSNNSGHKARVYWAKLLVVPHQAKKDLTPSNKPHIIYSLKPTFLTEPETSAQWNQIQTLQNPSKSYITSTKKSCCPCCFFSKTIPCRKTSSSPTPSHKHPVLPPVLTRVPWREEYKGKPWSGSSVLKCSFFP